MIYILIVIIILLCICLTIYVKKANVQIQENVIQIAKNQQLEEDGKKLQQKNEELQNEKNKTENYLAGIKIAVQTQENVLKSLKATSENLREDAKKQADQEYQVRLEALAALYDKKEIEYKEKYEQAIKILNKQLLLEQDKLEDLEAKQIAYVEAQKRAVEMKTQQDFYRLLLSDYDISDIKLLRDLQIRFARKDVIDKVIWEVYYRPAFDIFAGKALPKDKICGIYKITNIQNQQAYIGQSVDIKERIREHIKNGLSHKAASNKLYQEMQKCGPENFTFEILEQVPREKLNEREIYWINFYKTKEFGLNVTKGGA